jgi:hypothetical protein
MAASYPWERPLYNRTMATVATIAIVMLLTMWALIVRREK